jgi:multicomponent Na+:H+ antiporter subunit E
MLSMVRRFALMLVVWLVITGANPQALLIGLLAAAAATALGLRLLPPGSQQVSMLTLLELLPGFLADSLRGGLDVARRALHPSLPVRPGWIDYPLRLPPGAGRVSLGDLLSLMPGTLAAGEHRDGLCVHCLEVTESTVPQIAREEARIGRSMGIELESGHG